MKENNQAFSTTNYNLIDKYESIKSIEKAEKLETLVNEVQSNINSKVQASYVPIIEFIEKLARAINKDHFHNEINNFVIFISDSTRKSSVTCIKSQGYEFKQINIPITSLETFDKLAIEVSKQLVHLLNSQYIIKDHSRGGTYLNSKFVRVATELGLQTVENEKNGFEIVGMTEAYTNYLNNFKQDYEKIDLTIMIEIKERKAKNHRKLYSYVCPTCGEKVYSSKDNMNVYCGECNVKMECNNKDTENESELI